MPFAVAEYGAQFWAMNLSFVVFSTLLLWKGADWLVEAATKIARSLGVSDLVIGLTIVSFGTSAPEFAVTIFSTINGKHDLPVANIVGSNVFNLGFILGGCAAFASLKTTKTVVYRDGLFLIFVTLLLRFFLGQTSNSIFNDGITAADSGGAIFTKIEGGIMFGLLIAYNIFLFTRKEGVDDDEIAEGEATWHDWGWLLMGLIGVVSGGKMMEHGAVNIATAMGVSEWAIGVTIVAAATSLPEFATSMMAIYRGRHGLSVGNLIGSDLFNLLGVLGLAGILGPLHPSTEAIMSTNLLIGMVVLVVVFMRTGYEVSRTEGLFLVVLNLIRWIYDFTHRAGG